MEQLCLNEKDEKKYKWNILPNMKQKRVYPTSILIQNNQNQFIITIGGYNKDD